MVRRKNSVGWSHTNMLAVACTFVLVSILSSTSIAQRTPISGNGSRKRADPVPSTTTTTKSPSKPEKPVVSVTTKKTVKPTTTGPSITEADCNKVRKQYVNLGFSIDIAVKSPMPGTSQSVCGSSYTCCSKRMEMNLYHDISRKVQHSFRSHLRKRYLVLRDQELKLKSYMHKLLNTSYILLHKMFVQTYGLHYNQNSAVFVTFYNRMHNYLRGREADVTKIVTDFFREMCSRMINMFHMQSTANYKSARPINPHLLSCLSHHFFNMDPYKGGPKGIKKDLIRSLTAGRTLAMAIGVQREVLAQILSKMVLAPECVNALTRVKHCAMCKAELGAKPCPNFCSNVIRGCFAQVYKVSNNWSELSKRVLKLVNLLEGRNSLEHIFENSLSVKISEAITNFQFNFNKQKKTLYSKCRRPYTRTVMSGMMRMKPKRRRRSASGRFSPERKQDLKRLLNVLRNHVLRPQQNLLPNTVDSLCKKSPFQSSTDRSQCWNGTAMGSYEGALVSATLPGQISNPEVAVDVSRQPASMVPLQSLLRAAKDRVNSAVHEKEVPVLQFATTSVHGGGRRTGGLLEGSGSGPLPVEMGSGVAPPATIGKSKSKPVERVPEDDEVALVRPRPLLPKGVEGSGTGRLLEGSGIITETSVRKVTKVTKVSSTVRPPKSQLPQSTPPSKTSSFTTTTTRPITTSRKPLSKIKNIRPPIDDAEGSGMKEMVKPEQKLPEVPELKQKEKNKKGPLPSRPIDEEVTGSGAGTDFGNGEDKWKAVRKPVLGGGEGSGAGSGFGQPTDFAAGRSEVSRGGYINPDIRQPENRENSYPRTLWVPKSVKVVEDPDAGYQVRPDRNGGPSAQGNTDCNPKCTGFTSTPINNLLLLLTVALLAAAMLV